MNHESKHPSQYKTPNLALAATISLNIPLESIERIQGSRKAYFIFPNTDDVRSLVSDFWNRTLTVEPQAYFDQLKAIKTRLYEVIP